MTIQITTTKTETELRVRSKYSGKIVSVLKTHGGKWDATTNEWVFTNGGIKNGINVVDELFGLSDESVYIEVGKADDGYEYISNKKAIDLGVAIPRPDMANDPMACGRCLVRQPKFGWSEYDAQIIFGGYVLASRKGRDYSANIIETLVKGSFGKTGGSVKNPTANCTDDSVFGLHVRKDFAVRNELISKDEPKITLELERTTLLARLAEIEELLK